MHTCKLLLVKKITVPYLLKGYCGCNSIDCGELKIVLSRVICIHTQKSCWNREIKVLFVINMINTKFNKRLACLMNGHLSTIALTQTCQGISYTCICISASFCRVELRRLNIIPYRYYMYDHFGPVQKSKLPRGT